MGVIIHRPRVVIRQILEEPLNRHKIPAHKHSHVDEILSRDEEEWTQQEFHFLWHCGSLCDD